MMVSLYGVTGCYLFSSFGLSISSAMDKNYLCNEEKRKKANQNYSTSCLAF